MEIIGQIKYSWYNPIKGQEQIVSENVVSVKEWNENDVDYKLECGKTICAEKNRAELYGKSGNYLKLIQVLEFSKPN